MLVIVEKMALTNLVYLQQKETS